MEFKLYGDLYDERLILTEEEEVIYDGFVDDFVTSISGQLEFRFNYGGAYISTTIAKSIGDDIIFVPKQSLLFKQDYKYKTICTSITILKKLWTMLKYNIDDDLKYIFKLNTNDVYTMWLAFSGFKSVSDDYPQNIKDLQSECYYIDYDQTILHQLFDDKYWLYSSIQLINCKKNSHRFITIFLESGIEWKALIINGQEEVYLNTDSKYSIKIR